MIRRNLSFGLWYFFENYREELHVPIDALWPKRSFYLALFSALTVELTGNAAALELMKSSAQQALMYS